MFNEQNQELISISTLDDYLSQSLNDLDYGIYRTIKAGLHLPEKVNINVAESTVRTLISRSTNLGFVTIGYVALDWLRLTKLGVIK